MKTIKQPKQHMFIGTLARFSEKYEDIQVKIVECEVIDPATATHCVIFVKAPFKYVENIFKKDSKKIRTNLALVAIENTMLFS